MTTTAAFDVKKAARSSGFQRFMRIAFWVMIALNVGLGLTMLRLDYLLHRPLDYTNILSLVFSWANVFMAAGWYCSRYLMDQQAVNSDTVQGVLGTMWSPEAQELLAERVRALSGRPLDEGTVRAVARCHLATDVREKAAVADANAMLQARYAASAGTEAEVGAHA